MDMDALSAELLKPAYAGLSDADCIPLLLTVTKPGTGLSAMLTPDEFVGRFTPEETVTALDSPDAVVRALMFRMRVRRDPLDLDGDTVKAGVAYMAGLKVEGLGSIAAPITTPERIAAILAKPDVTAFPGLTVRDVWIARGQPEGDKR